MVDRRYGTGNKYGNGRLYGASDAPIVDDRFRWGVDVAWETKYSGDNEADYMTHLYVFRGRRSFLNPNGQGFAPIETGRARITLDNSDGRYDAWNTSSPLYPYVEPGKDVRIRVRDLDSGTTYSIFTGVIVDIETIGYGADAKVILVCEDYWYYLRNQNIRYQNVRLDLSVSEIIGSILNVFGSFRNNPYTWVYGTALDSSTDLIPYWWSSNSLSMAEIINDLAQSFFGKFFLAANGVATYYDRNIVRISVQTYTQSQMSKDIGNSQPWKNQRNTIRIKVHPRTAEANQVVWSLSEPMEIPNGNTKRFTAIFTYNGATVPVMGPGSTPSVNWHAWTNSDGTGTELTSGFTPSLAFSYGDSIDLEIINNSGSDGYLTDFDWVGQPVPETGLLDAAYPTTRPTQPRELLIDSIWHQRIDSGEFFATGYGSQLSTIRQFPVIAFDTRPESLVPDLFQIVTVSIAKLGITNTDFEVGGIEIETTNETCQAFTVRQYLEPHFTSA